MAGPWERYQNAGTPAPASKPWDRYRTPAPSPAPAADEGPGFMRRAADAAGSAVTYAGQEFARGVTNIAGFPVDMVNMSPMIANLLPGEQGFGPLTDYPVGGSEFLWDAVTGPRDAFQEATGFEPGDRPAANAFERILGKTTEEVGAAAIPMLGILKKSLGVPMHAARAMQNSARPIQRIAGRTLEAAKANPVAFAGKETGMAAAAGTGAGVAREIASDGDPNTNTRAEIIADILGSLGGASMASLGTMVAKGGKDVLASLFSPENFATELARTEAADVLGMAAGAPVVPSGAVDTSGLATALGGSRRISDVVEGFRDTTADVLQSPGVAELEFSRQMGTGAGKFKQRRNANQDAANDALGDLAPDATPGALSESLRTRRSDLEAELQAYLDDIEMQDVAARDSLSPSIASGEARGAATRSALENAKETARAAEREAWAGISGEVDPAPLASSFDEIYGRLTMAQRRIVDDVRAAIDTPSALKGDTEEDLLSAVLGPDGRPFPKQPSPISEMTDLAEVTSLRSEFTTAARQAEAAGDPQKARILGQFVDAIDSHLDTQPAIAEALERARAASRDFNDRFTRRGDAVADSLATRPSGGPAVPDSAVAGKFVQPDRGQASNLDRLLRETGDADEVREAIRSEILDAVGRKDLLNKPERLEAFLGEYDQAFQKFPDLKEELGTAANIRKELNTADLAKSQQQRELFSASGNIVGRYLSFGDSRAVDAMRTVLNAKDPAAAADELLAFVGDAPEAVQGARAAFWDALRASAKSTGSSTKTGSGGQAWKFTQVFNFINKPANKAVLERMYRDDPEHLARIQEVAESLNRAEFSVTGRAQGSSGTPQGLVKGALPSAESVASRVFAVKRGVVSPQFAGFNLGTVMARKLMRSRFAEQFETILDQALLDPDVAEMITREYNPANVAALRRWAKSYGIAQMPEMIDLMEDGEDEETDMRKAVER